MWCQSTNPVNILVRFDLLNELKCAKIKYERFLFQNDDHHLFAKFDAFDRRVEGDLRSVFAFLIVPNHYFVLSWWQNQHDEVSFVHHLDQFYWFIQQLNLFLDPLCAGIVWDDFESLSGSHGEVLLSLIAWDGFNLRGVSGHPLLHNLLYFLGVYKSFLGLQDHPLVFKNLSGLHWMRLRRIIFWVFTYHYTKLISL